MSHTDDRLTTSSSPLSHPMTVTTTMKTPARRMRPSGFTGLVRPLSSLCLILALAAASGCGSKVKSAEDSWKDLRTQSAKSEDGAEVSDWLVAELLRPGGTPEQVKKARARLDKLGVRTMTAELARGLDDLGHGRVKAASEDFVRALVMARTSDDPRAPLIAWYAALHAYELSGQSPDFGERHKEEFEELLNEPGNIGFRAYAAVVDLWVEHAHANAEDDIDEKLAAKLGCAKEARIAGPFGTGADIDVLRSFSAEKTGPWPTRFQKEEGGGVPRVLSTERIGCDIEVDEPVRDGAFYAETYLELDKPEELILTAAGATRIWVNDEVALDRDVRVFGVWPKFGVRLKLSEGRHRVVWKMGGASTALRLMTLDGRPWAGKSSADPALGYSRVPPTIGADPNELMRFIRPTGVKDPKDDLTRYVASYLAAREGQGDVASLLFEPFVKDAEVATGLCLVTAAGLVIDDPIYDQTQTQELAHELEVRAAERDPGLWYPRLRSALWDANQKGPTEAVTPLRELVAEFPEVASLHNTLARTYEQLGWGPELEVAVRRLTAQFPDDADAIAVGIDFYEAEGDSDKVDQLLSRLREVSPDTEVFVARALRRADYDAALAELRRLGERRGARKDIPARIEEVLVRSGDKPWTLKQLEEAIEREPRDVHSRLALADAELSAGKRDSLAKALVSAVLAGAEPSSIEEAIDLVEGITELEPYRLSAKEVIREYEARGVHQSGTAARVLDYGAVLVRSDGSSRFLEHEVVRIQSEEGIKQFTEMDAGGHILHLRVLKKDGRVLEPEAVAGKPTVTMPHLEVGDYVEQERILSSWGDGLGERYIGPSWFFREQNVAYARSEFVLITPKDKKLVLESVNGVPAPKIESRGSYVVHRYRVDDSSAAPSEPNSPPASEFMPRVSVGWGVTFDRRIRDVSRSMASLSSVDPRIVRVAQKIVAKEKDSEVARARALYHWVLDSVQEGDESDGRRVVISRSGNRWNAFVTLCQALKIPVSWALAESRLSSPITGELSSVQRPLSPLLRVGTGKDATWITIDDQFAPYGTVAGHLRGEKAYLLGEMEAKVATVPREGAKDAIRYEGTGVLRENGSAKLSLRIVFIGQFAASLRNGLSQIPENQLSGIIESRLLGQELQGASLISHKVLDQDQLDRPLIIEVEVEAPQFATPSGDGLLLAAPFMPRIGQLTPLATRSTPLMIGDTTGQGLDLVLTVPEGMTADVARSSKENPRSQYEVQDKFSGRELHLVRDVATDAGRVTPAEYGAFQAYARDADAALSRAVRIKKR